MPSSNTFSPKSTRTNPTEQAFSAFRKSGKTKPQPQPLTKLQNQLFNANMGLVHHVAHRFEWTGEDYEDLAQIGAIGLMIAVKKFDPNMGYAFSSFAIRTITGEIMHFLRDHGSLVKVPRAWREMSAKGKKLEAKGLNAAEGLGISEDEWMTINEAHANQYHSSLEEVVVGEQDEATDEPKATLNTPEMIWAKTKRAIKQMDLNSEDQKILTAIAENDTKPRSSRKTREEIATELGLTERLLNYRLMTIHRSLDKIQSV
jgi:RNA polymerase sigma factor (sigma-70 family)